MEVLLRIAAGILSIIVTILNTVLNWIVPRKLPTYPPIANKLLTLSLGELVTELRTKKLKSEDLVRAYIERIEEVNPSLNAVIEHRFQEALKDAQHADQLIAKAKEDQLSALFARYPLLGIPFTVKESCGLKGLSFVVGNVHRMNKKCPDDGATIELLRAAGCIPLLVSANPEYCMSFETKTHTHGRCMNPYDLRRTTAGSSGGEGALNGSGASLFGVGSDIAGSIRLPALFNGVFGHKPTGGLLSVRGHFPNSEMDVHFPKSLQVGPITRFARDLPILLQIMAGKNAAKLKFSEGISTKEIKIYYAFGFDGISRFTHPPTAFDIKLSILRAVKYFEKGGLETKEVSIKGFKNALEICLSGLVTMQGIPSIISQSAKTKPKPKALVIEILRSLIGHSLYTTEALIMELMQGINAFIPKKAIEIYKREAETVKQELIDLLGTNGVLFFPTFHTPAIHFNTSLLNIVGIDMMLLFNVLGLPSTHVPMGLNSNGFPIGFQVIAAPYQDKLCLQIAAELEDAFNGWVEPKTKGM